LRKKDLDKAIDRLAKLNPREPSRSEVKAEARKMFPSTSNEEFDKQFDEAFSEFKKRY